MVYEWVTSFLENWHMYGSAFKFLVAHPNKIQTLVTPFGYPSPWIVCRANEVKEEYVVLFVQIGQEEMFIWHHLHNFDWKEVQQKVCISRNFIPIDATRKTIPGHIITTLVLYFQSELFKPAAMCYLKLFIVGIVLWSFISITEIFSFFFGLF